MVKSEEEFAEIPRLRVRKDEDGCWIAKTIIKRLKGDHLYFHGPGKLGIYYQGDTRMATTYKRTWWEKLVGKRLIDTLSQPGDYDGILIFKIQEISDIPYPFLKTDRGSGSIFKKNAERTGPTAQG